MRYAVVFALVTCFCSITTPSAAGRDFLSGYAGSVPSAKNDLAKTYFYRPEVQRLLTELEKAPVEEGQAAQILGTTTALGDLERLKLVVRDHSQVRIGFAYFTAADSRLIHTMAAKYVPSLVKEYRQDNKLKMAFARYPVTSIEPKRLAFVLIAGFALNWDALSFTLEKHYREPLLIRGADDGKAWKYSFWASEAEADYSYRGYYWGSSSFPAGAINLTPPLDVTYSSFGDPDSDPRMNFPDLLALTAPEMTKPVRDAAEMLGLHDDNSLNMGLKGVIGLDRSQGLADILFALRRGGHSKAAVCKGERECLGDLGLLEAAGYIGKKGGQYVLLVPVFAQQDRPMVAAVLAENRVLLSGWLKDNYEPIKRDLAGLTAVRQGVPYPVLFTQIWHEIFGLATRELAASGVVEDPRAPGSIWNGSIPVVWHQSVYHQDLQ